MRATTSSMAAAKRLRREMSRPEYLLWVRLKELRGSGMRIRRQHAIGPFVADFYCAAARLVIEIDGMHHDHRSDSDFARSEYFASLGLRTVRWEAKAVLADPDGCADAASAYAAPVLAPPPLSLPAERSPSPLLRNREVALKSAFDPLPTVGGRKPAA